MATPSAVLLRSWGRPSPLHQVSRKGSVLPRAPTPSVRVPDREGRAAAPRRTLPRTVRSGLIVVSPVLRTAQYFSAHEMKSWYCGCFEAQNVRAAERRIGVRGFRPVQCVARLQVFTRNSGDAILILAAAPPGRLPGDVNVKGTVPLLSPCNPGCGVRRLLAARVIRHPERCTL